jgi:hypothetical protein
VIQIGTSLEYFPNQYYFRMIHIKLKIFTNMQLSDSSID